jgi:5-keto 4-deoxyuronate isomerase
VDLESALVNVDIKKAQQAYRYQSACRYGKFDRNGNLVEMKMTFEQWLDIWITSGHWHQRGNKKGMYVMARHNDLGHYEPNNVSIIPFEQNCRDAHLRIPKSQTQKQKLRNIRLGMKFGSRTQSIKDAAKKKIQTPCGVMLGREQVAEHYSVSKRTVSYWLSKKSNEFYYL